MNPIPALATVVVAATGDEMWSCSADNHAPDASGDSSSRNLPLSRVTPNASFYVHTRRTVHVI
jgi:hypothetical protein